MNETGYKNLLKLVTYSHLEGFYYKPRLDRELIEKYNEGLIAILPSFASELAQSLKGRNQEKAHEVADFGIIAVERLIMVKLTSAIFRTCPGIPAKV